MRRVVEILLRFTAATGHQHPHLRTIIGNYEAMLQQMGYNQEQVKAELDKLGAPFGNHPGS